MTLAAWVALAHAQDGLRPLKPALPVDPPASPWWPWLLLALIAAGAAAWFVRRRWNAERPVDPETALRRTLEEAREAFEAERHTEGADTLAAAVRTYLARRTPIDALHLTSEELLDQLEDRVPTSLLDAMRHSLASWDAARFAGRSLDHPGIPSWIEELIEVLRPGDDRTRDEDSEHPEPQDVKAAPCP